MPSVPSAVNLFMPELPEVETVVRDLRPLLVGRTLTAVRVGKAKLRRPWKKAWAGNLTGATVSAIGRRGKWIILDLSRGPESAVLFPPPLRGRVRAGGQASRVGRPPHYPGGLTPHPNPPPQGGREPETASPSDSVLLVHLGMTGQFTVTPAADPVADHTHVVFDLDDGNHLRFRDVRRFGSVEWFPDAASVEVFLADRLGSEPFDLDPATFRAAVQRTTRTLKAILLDQTVVAGVGNIYADEALHRTGLHPERRGTTVTDAEADRLREMIAAVLIHAIENRGSTIRDYIGGSGLRGGFQHEFRVYGRTGDPCGSCAVAIEVVRVAGRSSHYCPHCQKISPQRARRAQRKTMN